MSKGEKMKVRDRRYLSGQLNCLRDAHRERMDSETERIRSENKLMRRKMELLKVAACALLLFSGCVSEPIGLQTITPPKSKHKALTLPAKYVTLAWNANPETNISGYVVYWGASRAYTNSVPVTDITEIVTNLIVGTNYFAVTARTQDGLESDFSEEVSAVISANRVRVTLQSAIDVSGPWLETQPGERDLNSPTEFFRIEIQPVK